MNAVDILNYIVANLNNNIIAAIFAGSTIALFIVVRWFITKSG